MTIELFYFLFIVLISIYALAAHHGFVKLKFYNSKNQTIRTESDIEELKELLKGQMNLAAITLPSGGLAIFLHTFYFFDGLLSLSDTFVLVCLIAVNFYFTSIVKKQEIQIKKTPSENDTLETEKKRIIEIWQTKMRPNFD